MSALSKILKGVVDDLKKRAVQEVTKALPKAMKKLPKSVIEPSERRSPMDLKTAAKAWVAATVAFVGLLVAAKFGFEIQLGMQEFIAAGLLAFVSWLATWLVPNKA